MVVVGVYRTPSQDPIEKKKNIPVGIDNHPGIPINSGRNGGMPLPTVRKIRRAAKRTKGQIDVFFFVCWMKVLFGIFW